MLSAPTYRSVEGAYLALLQLASTNHEQRISARGNEAREVIGVGFRLLDPRQRLPYLATRKVNPVFQFAESLWYLAGRRDLEMIGYYAPSMRSSSADGAALGGSAYGHTLFNPTDGDTVLSIPWFRRDLSYAAWHLWSLFLRAAVTVRSNSSGGRPPAAL
ncbi:hypothetical protein LJ657_44050, partial [Streptomyces sp. NR30]|nr:hypothetical protein [Streptomyces guryensis]